MHPENSKDIVQNPNLLNDWPRERLQEALVWALRILYWLYKEKAYHTPEGTPKKWAFWD